MRDRLAPNSPASQRPPGGAGRHREQTPSAFRKPRTVTDARPHLQPGRWERIRPQQNYLRCGNLARPFKAAPTRWGASVQRPQLWCFSNENGDRGSAPREPGSLKGGDGVAFHFSQRRFSWDPSFRNQSLSARHVGDKHTTFKAWPGIQYCTESLYLVL